MTDTTDATTQHNLNESADKIRLKTQVKRGTATRDQDTIEVKVRGDDPDDAVDTLNATLTNLRETADAARAIQPEGDDD
jgi:phosphotransferase system HPr-like phosphotransfer protein